MRSFCTKGIQLLAIALLLLGAAACTQQKPVVPTPTLVIFDQTPVLPAGVSETPGPQGTAPPAVGTSVPGAATAVPVQTESVGPVAPTPLPTPTSGFPTSVPVQPPPAATPSQGGTQAGTCTNPYIVLPGEHIYQIARKCGVSPQALIAANPYINPNLIVPGQKLNMP
jgi:LysM repeat protein